MICPLMSHQASSGGAFWLDTQKRECLKEDCAWWIKENPQDTREDMCAIKQLAEKEEKNG